MENKFEREVLERLIVLETLIKEQDYKSIKKTSDEADNRSKDNEKRLDKLESGLTWLTRSVIGFVITAILTFVFMKK